MACPIEVAKFVNLLFVHRNPDILFLRGIQTKNHGGVGGCLGIMLIWCAKFSTVDTNAANSASPFGVCSRLIFGGGGLSLGT